MITKEKILVTVVLLLFEIDAFGQSTDSMPVIDVNGKLLLACYDDDSGCVDYVTISGDTLSVYIYDEPEYCGGIDRFVKYVQERYNAGRCLKRNSYSKHKDALIFILFDHDLNIVEVRVSQWSGKDKISKNVANRLYRIIQKTDGRWYRNPDIVLSDQFYLFIGEGKWRYRYKERRVMPYYLYSMSISI